MSDADTARIQSTDSQKYGPQKPGPIEQRVGDMLRVDHAGEYGAVAIYQGQRAVFERLPHKAKIAAQIAEMEAGEEHHLETFNRLLRERGVRPSLLAPLWNGAGYGLGVATALMGEKAAMACTEAVETVIEQHYGEQAKTLEEVEPELAATVKQFREDEIEHRDTAHDAGAQEAPGYTLLSGVIKAGCHLAIKVASKI